MTAAEKHGIRERALGRYMCVVDDRKAHCGRLAELIESFRHVVGLYDAQDIHVSGGQDASWVFGHDEASGFRLPSHDDVVKAFQDCQKARQAKHRLLVDAINAGVDRHALDALAARGETPRSTESGEAPA